MFNLCPVDGADGDPAMLHRNAEANSEASTVCTDEEGDDALGVDAGDAQPRRYLTAGELSRRQAIFPGSHASKEECAAAYQAIAARWNPPREFMVDLANMNRQLLFPHGNVAPSWYDAQALDMDGTRRFHVLHLCPGPPPSPSPPRQQRERESSESLLLLLF